MSESTDHPTIVDKISEGYYQAQRDDEKRRADAAAAIQRAWRQKCSRVQIHYLSSDLRWKDAAMRAKLRVQRSAADEGKNTAKERWNRAGFFASKLRDGNTSLKQTETEQNHNSLLVQKHLETQHWLELIDSKHRYGSNLKYYHKRWKEADTTDNFFKWLDHGDGKELSLNECPREQLEKERITYLSAEQRLNYLVKIDSEGKLRWARNDELVDTSPGRWKDSGNGEGIVPEDMPEQPIQRRGSFETGSSSSSLSSEVAMHYIEPPMGKTPWSRAFHKYFTLRGITNRLLRKTVQRNTWIYVSDKNYNLFIGIKTTGTFQHSTLLAGGLVTSAGLISVRDGLVHTLSPLSGHYRTSIDHFHRFIDEMTNRGVDMRKAKISRAEAALWGIEHLAKWKKKQSRVKEAGKVQASKAGHAVADVLKVNDSSWKREILEGRKQNEELGADHQKDSRLQALSETRDTEKQTPRL